MSGEENLTNIACFLEADEHYLDRRWMQECLRFFNNHYRSWPIRAVLKDQLGTRIVPLDPATTSIIYDRLYTPGQLLRQDGLF